MNYLHFSAPTLTHFDVFWGWNVDGWRARGRFPIQNEQFNWRSLFAKQRLGIGFDMASAGQMLLRALDLCG